MVLSKQGATKSDPFHCLIEPAEYYALVRARNDEAAAREAASEEATSTGVDQKASSIGPTETHSGAAGADEIFRPSTGRDQVGGEDILRGKEPVATAGPAGISAAAEKSTANVAADDGNKEPERPAATAQDATVPEDSTRLREGGS